jgi:hypothetical protein
LAGAGAAAPASVPEFAGDADSQKHSPACSMAALSGDALSCCDAESRGERCIAASASASEGSSAEGARGGVAATAVASFGAATGAREGRGAGASRYC